MGLDTTYNCWSGAYSAFHRWRKKLAEVAGYGDLDHYYGFDGNKEWPGKGVIEKLLHHSDCDGSIGASDCTELADALERLLPALEVAGDGGGHVGGYAQKTRQFIDGLRAAAAAGEDVEFL